jgi:hypothetical protein
VHGAPARLVRCNYCGLTIRDEASAARYEDDLYDSPLTSHLYPRYLKSFRRKESQYRLLLRPRAPILEVGSHYGAFLEVAESWDWRPIGLDIGKYTSAFARSRGLTLRRLPIQDFNFRYGRAEGIFVRTRVFRRTSDGSCLS